MPADTSLSTAAIAAAIVLAMPAATSAQIINPNALQILMPKLSCAVHFGQYRPGQPGTPQFADPDSVIITNTGVVPVPVGTVIRWTIDPSPGQAAQRGTAEAYEDMLPGAVIAVTLDNQPSTGICSAEALIGTGR
jgi:hypothetical protein